MKKRRNRHSIQNMIKWVPIFSVDNSLIWDFYGTLFWQKIAPNSPSSSLWSGNALADSSVASQFDGILKEEHILLFVCCLFDGITAWTSGRRIAAHIYYKSGLIRLGLLCPIGLRCEVYQLGLCAFLIVSLIKQAGTLKRKRLNHMGMRAWERSINAFWIFRLRCQNQGRMDVRPQTQLHISKLLNSRVL